MDKKYVVLSNSSTFETAGEGAFATIDVPKDTVFVLYGGMLYDEYQNRILNERINEERKKNGWQRDDPQAIAQWKYKYYIHIFKYNNRLYLFLRGTQSWGPEPLPT